MKQRTIEFRAWDGTKMYSPAIVAGVSWDMIRDIPLKDDIIMQFTGLHDRNGNKIFEGDVVRDKYDEIGVVEMHNGSYKLKYGTKRLGFGSYAKQCEIIGNIFQPPNHG